MTPSRRDDLVRTLATLLALLGGAALVLAVRFLVEYADGLASDPFAGLALAVGLAALVFAVPTLLLSLPVVARPRRLGVALAGGLWTTLAMVPFVVSVPLALVPICAGLALVVVAAHGLGDRAATARARARGV